MPDGIKIIGADEVVARLAALPAKMQAKIIRPVMREEAKVVLKKAKELVPVDADGHQLPGGKHLRDTLKVRVAPRRRKSGRSEISFVVKTGTRKELGIPGDEKGYYPFALEYGDVLNWQPIPYMRPAYIATRDVVVESARKKILAGLEDVMRGFR